MAQINLSESRALLLTKEKDSTIESIQIVGYPFNHDFCEYLGGLVNENKAYSKILMSKNTNVVRMEKFEPDNLTHHTIINSVVEFIVLHRLDLHLNSYFRENEIDTDNIVNLTRKELSAEVLKNRVIDQITKDMRERPAFSNDIEPDTEGVVVYSQGDDGAIYQRLELELPPNSKIFRNADGFLVIKNPLFNMTIIPKYEGFGATLSKHFVSDLDEFLALKMVRLKLHIQIKNAAFFAGTSMKMYEWLDSFIEELHNCMCADRLMRRLDSDLVEMLNLRLSSTGRKESRVGELEK